MVAVTRILTAIAILQAATMAQAQSLPASTPEEIYAGTQSCLSATTASAVDIGKLQADGWHPASVSQGGAPFAPSLSFYGEKNLLIMIDQKSKKPLCFLTATLPDADTFNDVAFALDSGLGVHGKANAGEASTIYFFPAGHIVQLSKTGTPTHPAVRVVVGYHSN